MNEIKRQKIYILGSADVFYKAIAAHLTGLINISLNGKDYFNLVLSGGDTPRELYRLLATEYRQRIPWPKIRLYWCDERLVAHDHPESNYRMVKETLLIDQPLPSENIFPMPTDLSTPEEAASSYENLLRSYFDGLWPRFDLILLGLGADGHTASLFPGTPAINEKNKWVVTTTQPKTLQSRLSLTLPVLNQARHIYFIVTGKDKSHALQRATSDPPDPINCPASAVRPVDGELNWWADWQAAQLI